MMIKPFHRSDYKAFLSNSGVTQYGQTEKKGAFKEN